MNCTHCHANYDNGAQYCAQCGNKTIYNPTLNKGNNNVTAVWLFAGLFIGMQLLYRLLSHVIIPSMRNLQEPKSWEAIGRIYETVDILNLLLDLLVSGIVIAIIKNTPARIAVGLFAAVSLFLFVLEKVLKVAEMGTYAPY